MPFDLAKFLDSSPEKSASADDDAIPAAPLAGTRGESRQRLQVGLSGVGVIVLLLVVVDVVVDRTAQTQADTVQTDPAVIAAEESPLPQTDPLADAGVVPDLPVEPAADTAGAQAAADNGTASAGSGADETE